MNDRETEVLIVGGGIIGLACAHYLLQAGRSVRIVDAGRLGHGSSWGNCGLITPSHAVPLAMPGMIAKALLWMLNRRAPFYVRPTLRPSMLRWLCEFAGNCNRTQMQRALHSRAALLNSSRGLFETLIDEYRLECEWQTSGVLVVYRSAGAMHTDEALQGPLSEVGVESQAFVGPELRDLEPALRDDLYGGRLYPADAYLRPDRLVAEMARVVRARGARVDEDCDVRDLDVEHDAVRAVQTSRGELRAERFVLATGALTPQVARRLRLDLPIEPGKGYTVTMPRPEVCPTYPCILQERGIGVTPWASGYRLGGTMELGGYDRSLNRSRIAAILEGAAEYLRESACGSEAEHWYGWRPMTPDELPFIGRSPGQRNVFVAAGHGMLGVSMAPATGKLVAELVTGTAPHIDPRPYRLSRTRARGAATSAG